MTNYATFDWPLRCRLTQCCCLWLVGCEAIWRRVQRVLEFGEGGWISVGGWGPSGKKKRRPISSASLSRFPAWRCLEGILTMTTMKKKRKMITFNKRNWNIYSHINIISRYTDPWTVLKVCFAWFAFFSAFILPVYLTNPTKTFKIILFSTLMW